MPAVKERTLSRKPANSALSPFWFQGFFHPGVRNDFANKTTGMSTTPSTETMAAMMVRFTLAVMNRLTMLALVAVVRLLTQAIGQEGLRSFLSSIWDCLRVTPCSEPAHRACG